MSIDMQVAAPAREKDLPGFDAAEKCRHDERREHQHGDGGKGSDDQRKLHGRPPSRTGDGKDRGRKNGNAAGESSGERG
jgi:hypothetical protein